MSNIFNRILQNSSLNNVQVTESKCSASHKRSLDMQLSRKLRLIIRRNVINRNRPRMIELANNFNVTIINMCNDVKAIMDPVRKKMEDIKLLECQNVKNLISCT